MRSFSIRHLLVLIAAAAALLALITSIHTSIDRERKAADRISGFGGKVTRQPLGMLAPLIGNRVSAVELHSIGVHAPGETNYNPVDDLWCLPKLAVLRINGFDIRDRELRGLAGVNSDLRELSVSGVRGSHRIISQAKRFRELESLSLTVSDLSSSELAGLDALTHLAALDLFASTVTDRDLSAIGRITTLQSLKLSETNITGRTLGELKQLTRLESLAVSTRSPPPASVKEFLASMQEIGVAKGESATSAEAQDLSINQLPTFPSLRTLVLGGCKFDAASLNRIGRQPQLVELHLKRCRFPTDISGSTIAGWDVKYLALVDCEITPELLEAVATLKSLTTVYITDQSLGFADLAPLTKIPQLETLVVCEFRNDGETAVLRQFPKLRALSINGTKLSAQDHKNLPQVKHLDVNEYLVIETR